MNRNDDFDKTLESWLHRQAPPQAPDRVLESAMERVAVQSQKRTWLHRLVGETPMATMTRVAAVTAVVAVAALIGFQFGNLSNDNVGNSPSPSAFASPTPAVSASPEPSAVPSDARLLLRLMGGAEFGRYHAVTILDDGRVISGGVPATADPIVERRLTAAGVQLVRDELDSTGLTDTPGDYNPVPNPGVEPPGYGGAGPSLEVGQPAGEPIVINWFLFGETEEDYFQPQPEAEALEELYRQLTTLEEWLPASAWADASPSPYEAIDYRVTILEQDWGGSLDDLPVESSTVSWPLDPELDAYGAPVATGGDELRCGMASAAEATALQQALETAGATVSDQKDLSFMLGDRANGQVLTITLDPILPLDETGCEGATFPF